MSALKQKNYSYSTPGPPLRRARMGEAAEFTAGTTDEGRFPVTQVPTSCEVHNGSLLTASATLRNDSWPEP